MAGTTSAHSVLVFRDGNLDTVLTASVERDEIVAIYAMRNPDKLAWLRE